MTIVGIEEWREVPGTRHDASSLGRVRQHINATHSERRQIAVRKFTRDKEGYFFLRIAGTRWLVHRLIYSVFCGPLIDGLVVCHLDGNRANNVPANLLQVTQRTSARYKVEHGTHQIGQKHPRALYSDKKARKVKQAIYCAPRSITGRLKRGYGPAIAAQHGVNIFLVHDISADKTWKHI
jgi:hypothetical protein